MTGISFEAALDQRVGEMLDACTKCGKCVEACPSVAPAGIADALAAGCHRRRAGSRPHAATALKPRASGPMRAR